MTHVYKCEFQDETHISTFIFVIGFEVGDALEKAKSIISQRKPGGWTCISCERVIADLNTPRP